jgi:hypothetical protein
MKCRRDILATDVSFLHLLLPDLPPITDDREKLTGIGQIEKDEKWLSPSARGDTERRSQTTIPRPGPAEIRRQKAR